MKFVSAIIAGTLIGIGLLAMNTTTEAKVDPYIRNGAPFADYNNPSARLIWCQDQYLTITFQEIHPDEDGNSWYNECVSFLER